MLKHLIAAGTLLLALATAATASPLRYDMDVVFTDGPLKNKIYEGTFSIEDDAFMGSGIEVFSAAGLERQLLSFALTVNDDVFSLNSVSDLTRTTATFIDGQFSKIQYLGTTDGSGLALDSTARYFDGTPSRAVSRGIYVAHPATIGVPAPVPLPASAQLLVGGLGLLGLLVRRQARSGQSMRR